LSPGAVEGLIRKDGPDLNPPYPDSSSGLLQGNDSGLEICQEDGADCQEGSRTTSQVRIDFMILKVASVAAWISRKGIGAAFPATTASTKPLWA